MREIVPILENMKSKHTLSSLKKIKWKPYRKRPDNPRIVSVCSCSHKDTSHRRDEFVMDFRIYKKPRKEKPRLNRCTICMCNNFETHAQMTYAQYHELKTGTPFVSIPKQLDLYKAKLAEFGKTIRCQYEKSQEPYETKKSS